MDRQETDEVRELTTDEVDLVEGGLRFAALYGGGTLALGVEIGDTRYIVNIGHGAYRRSRSPRADVEPVF